jgi:hypothetical protein
MLRDSLTPYKLCCYIVKKFVKSKNIAWGYEINQAKKLLKFESKDTFWFKIKSKELKSLDWLLSYEGKKFLLKEKALLDVDKTNKITYNLKDDKIGNDKPIIKKPKTLKEFLNGKT